MRRGKRDDEEQALTGHNGWTRSHKIRVIFSQDIYCGGYSGEDPPLPIPNREVKLAIADGTAPPGGRVGSCHFLLETFEVIRLRRSFFVRGSESTPSPHFVRDPSRGISALPGHGCTRNLLVVRRLSVALILRCDLDFFFDVVVVAVLAVAGDHFADEAC